MSQIDKIIYIPLLFWFIILISILYFLIFKCFLGVILSLLKVRVIYYKELKGKILLDSTSIKNISLKNVLYYSKIKVSFKDMVASLFKLKNI